jgi:hypothetical protein
VSTVATPVGDERGVGAVCARAVGLDDQAKLRPEEIRRVGTLAVLRVARDGIEGELRTVRS